jgi:SAM-dependent methyltransferase
MNGEKHATRPNYGLDAPGVVVGFGLLGGLLTILAVGIRWWIQNPSWRPFLFFGVIYLLTSALMVWSSKVGKLHMREIILDQAELRGDETVLDAGCGRGLLLIGAARRLSEGKAIGVDVWRLQDQSGNGLEAVWFNARIEGVESRIEIIEADLRSLPLADASVDVVVSNLVLHNIKGKEEREQAVRELVRVLKPGGRIVLCDIGRTGEYLSVLQACDMKAERSGLYFWIYPPVRVVRGVKSRA